MRWQIGSALLLLCVAGQAMAAATISGTVKPADNNDLSDSVVVATSDTFKVYRVTVGDDGTYTADVDPGTYTIVALGKNQETPIVKDKVLKDGDKLTQDFAFKAATPFPIVKAAAPIPLTDDIDSASFQDAPEIQINGGQNVVVGDPNAWGGPDTVSGRFKIKWSDQALHLAADVTYMTPRVNNQTEGNLWNGNALEFDFQNDPYDPTRTSYDADHNWQLVVGLGDSPDWWLHGALQAHPAVNWTDEGLLKHFAIQDKGEHEQRFRLDVPWAVLLDSTGKGISPPKEGDMAAMDVVLDASDPAADRTTAARLFQVAWSGFEPSHGNPSFERPIQFVTQAPSTTPPAGP